MTISQQRIEEVTRAHRFWRRIAFCTFIVLAASVYWGFRMMRAETERQRAEAEALHAAAERRREEQEPFIERNRVAEQYFETTGQKAFVYRYGGGPVECWLEVATNGQKQRFNVSPPGRLPPQEDSLPGPLVELNNTAGGNSLRPVVMDQTRGGEFVWASSPCYTGAEETGEIWMLGLRNEDGQDHWWFECVRISVPPMKYANEPKQGEIGFPFSGGGDGGGRSKLIPGRELHLWDVSWTDPTDDNKVRRKVTLKCRLLPPK